mmetsp:Transcript_34700/g.61031  ORF Transcript_34700/g.61031 Transcript_34700/m.61031 type:complete len:224 (-) Transcript_34700:321-992(-)
MWDDFRIHPSYGCDCSDCCSCPCGEAYTREGRLKSICEDSPEVPIQECGLQCRCPSDCSNRVLQLGVKMDMVVQDAGSKGKGLFAAQGIEEGRFVIEYKGSFVSKETEGPYVFQLREHTARGILVTTLDGSDLDNIGRYINHSCNPNLTPQAVRASHALPHIGMFSLRRISEGEELTFDYNRPTNKLCQCISQEEKDAGFKGRCIDSNSHVAENCLCFRSIDD